MGESGASAPASGRLDSLDVFRGITIGLMVIVNNPGTWSAMYPPLAHAPWHGWTPTDFVFPFFLFIVGVAMTFSFDKRLQRGDSKLRLFEQVAKRTIILICLGLIMAAFPNWRLMGPYIAMIAGLNLLYADEPPFGMPASAMGRVRKVAGAVLALGALVWWVRDFSYFHVDPAPFLADPKEFANAGPGKYLRLPGVLQRIALCYFAGSLIMFWTTTRGRVIWIAALLIGYWVAMATLKPPADYTTPGPAYLADLKMPGAWDAPESVPYRGEFNDWLDVKLIGPHLYKARPDPEGIFSTIPAIATALIGVLVGTLLKSGRTQDRKAVDMFLWAGAMILMGWVVSWWFPVNKKIWTSSYVLLMGGFATLFLASCYALIDIHGSRKWIGPLVVFGTNPILLFFGSGILSRIMSSVVTVPIMDAPPAAAGEVPFTLARWAEGIGARFIGLGAKFPIDKVHETDLKTWFYQNCCVAPMKAIGGEGFDVARHSSFMFAALFLLLWLGLLYPLYRKKIFLKV